MQGFQKPVGHLFFQMPLRQCHFVKGHVAIFFKGHLGNAYAKQIPMGPGTATESWRSSSRTPGWCHPSSTQCLQDQAIGVCLVQRPFGHSIHVLFIYFFGWQFQFGRPNGHPAFCSTQKCIFIMTGRCVQLAKPAAAESCPGQRAQTKYQIALAAKKPAACIGTPTKATRPCHKGHKAIVSCMLQRPLAIFYKPFFWVNIPVTGSHSPAAQDFQPESHSTQHPSWHPRQP